jgi:hypothetical protein
MSALTYAVEAATLKKLNQSSGQLIEQKINDIAQLLQDFS